MWGVLRQNLNYGLRTLLKSSGFSLTAVLRLALGIAATTAIFSVVYAVFEPMPYPKPDQLVMVWSSTRDNRNSVSAADYLDWKQRSSSFQSWEAWAGAGFNLAGGDRPEDGCGLAANTGLFHAGRIADDAGTRSYRV